MDWLIPLLMIVFGALSLVMHFCLRRFLERNGDGTPSGYYSLHEVSERFSQRVPISWGFIGFGAFWWVTNIL